MSLEFSDYAAISFIDDWQFKEADIERAASYSVEDEEGYTYLTLYDENDEFIAEIEFSPNEVHTMQAYIDEYFDVSYEDTYYSDVWDRTAKITDIQRDYDTGAGVSVPILNNAFDTVDSSD